jgi:hypothetical protein
MSIGSVIRAGMSGALQLVGSYTVSGAAVTTFTISGLDLTSDGSYLVAHSFKNATASLSVISAYFNGDTTATNYDSQNYQSSGAATTSARSNASTYAILNASSTCTGHAQFISDVDGKPSLIFSQRTGATTLTEFRNGATMWRTAGNVTTIQFSASIASSIGIGSWVKIYKFGAPVTSGAAFPTSGLVDKQLFTRTDLGLQCYYDSSIAQWLTITEYALQGTTFTVGPHSSTATGPIQYSIPSDYNIYLTRYSLGLMTLTTSSGSQYWNYNLSQYDVDGIVIGSALATGSTISTAANKYLRYDAPLGVTVNASARQMFFIFTKVSTAGNLFPQSQTIFYRRIIT